MFILGVFNIRIQTYHSWFYVVFSDMKTLLFRMPLKIFVVMAMAVLVVMIFVVKHDVCVGGGEKSSPVVSYWFCAVFIDCHSWVSSVTGPLCKFDHNFDPIWHDTVVLSGSIPLKSPHRTSCPYQTPAYPPPNITSINTHSPDTICEDFLSCFG